MNDYLRQLSQSLPEPIGSYLNLVKAADLNALVREKYNFTLPQFRAYLDLVAAVYVKETAVESLPGEIKRIFGYSESVAKQLACDLAGVRLLVVADWLAADVAGFIRFWGGDPAKYQSHVLALQKALIEEADYLAKEWAEPAEAEESLTEETDWQAKAAYVKDMLAADFLETLRLDDEDVIGELNDAMLYLLSGDEALKEEWSNALLVNQEILGNQNLIIDGKAAAPTLANWLVYWFSRQGSGQFDVLALSSFMTGDSASAALNVAERELLSKLLITYRNLKFFPESLAGNRPDDWFIIPAPETAETEESTEFSAAEPQMSGRSDEKEAQLRELRTMVDRYPVGSLEREALEEEIEKHER